MNALERSKCVIEAILAHVGSTYKQVGGGGIREIKQNSSTSYTVAIPQEERVDLLIYEVEIDPAGRAKVVRVTTDTKSVGR